MAVPRRSLLLSLGAALIGATAAKCGPEQAGQPPAETATAPAAVPPPWEAQPDLGDTAKVVTISIWVEPEFRPLIIQMTADDHDTGEHRNLLADDDRGDHYTFKGDQFRHLLGYTSHHNVELNIHVQAAKPGSQRGYIAVKDGSRYGRVASFGGTAASSLPWRTQR